MCDPIPGADLRALRLSDPWARRRGEGLDVLLRTLRQAAWSAIPPDCSAGWWRRSGKASQGIDIANPRQERVGGENYLHIRRAVSHIVSSLCLSSSKERSFPTIEEANPH